MQNRVRLEIVDGPLTGKKFEFTEHDTESASLSDVERRHIQSILEQTGWVIEGARGAARILSLHPNTLRFRMQKLGIVRPHRAR